MPKKDCGKTFGLQSIFCYRRLFLDFDDIPLWMSDFYISLRSFMKIMRNVFLFTLLLLPFCSNAMYDNGRHHMRRLTTATAAVTLAANGDTRDVKKLSTIDPSDIVPGSVSGSQDDKNGVENYCATLFNSDSLSANRHANGEIECFRFICGVWLPVSDNHFFMLKDLYEKTQQEKANENK